MTPRLSSATRIWVLAAAFAAGLGAWMLTPPTALRSASAADVSVKITADAPAAKDAPAKDPAAPAGPAKAPAAAPPAAAKAAGTPAATAGQGPSKDSAKAAGKDAPRDSANGAAKDARKESAKDADEDADADTTVTITPKGIGVLKDGKKVHVGAFGKDREYDSFESFVQDAPWLAGVVFLTVFLVFLTPLLLIVLFIWYRFRKARMLNETMLKLAEKGVMPPAEAMEAIAGGRVASTIASAPSTAPLYEQAKQLRRRAASSDLRKGVLLAAFGFALTAWSTIGGDGPNGFGLIFLFVGLGYCLLWHFEEREIPKTTAAPGAPSGPLAPSGPPAPPAPPAGG